MTTQKYSTDLSTGLTLMQVQESIKVYGKNILDQTKLNALNLFLRQITGNSLIIVLAIVTIISFFLNERVSAIYVFWMIIIAIVLGFWNEYSAEKTVRDLLRKVTYKTFVIRDNIKTQIDAKDIVIGDLVYVGPGNVVPADFEIVECSKDLELNESALTGESLPNHKIEGKCLMGTIVISGWAKGVVTAIGNLTQFGKIVKNVSFIKPETDFQTGLRKFSKLMIITILILTVGIFGLNVFLGKDIILALMFSLAIAVGLTPELLPMIVTVSLSHGAGKLAKKGIISKQLVTIENLGNMDVLCTDKTGTLTEGRIRLKDLIVDDPEKYNRDLLLKYSLICNSCIVEHTVMGNPIDVAIWEYALDKNKDYAKDWDKFFEIPFDYENKSALAAFESNYKTFLIAKGAPEQIIEYCNHDNKKEKINEFLEYCKQGYRVIAVAAKEINKKDKFIWQDANDMYFVGLLIFEDTPKVSAKAALDKLQELNVIVKIITGDNEIITEKIAKDVDIENKDIITGEQIDKMSDDKLMEIVDIIDIFARMSPEQKLRILSILKKKGHVIGYMGDGVNDIPALHYADVGISVDTGVDVAKDAANMIITKKDLNVIAQGVIEGRKTFNNTVKYILMSTSSNFGNMLSAAGGSLFLPFLPMTPTQILLNNTLYDVSQMSVTSDNVDPESLVKPRHWDLKYIKNYMLFFGPLSSLYDFATYAILLFVLHASESTFQTGWFVESLATQVLVVFIIRTSRSPFFKSKPGKYLIIASVSLIIFAIFLTFTKVGKSIGFTPLPTSYYAVLAFLVVTYLGLVELSKKIFLRLHHL